MLLSFSSHNLFSAGVCFDAIPGKVIAGEDGEDHPAELISFWVLTKLKPAVSLRSSSSTF